MRHGMWDAICNGSYGEQIKPGGFALLFDILM